MLNFVHSVYILSFVTDTFGTVKILIKIPKVGKPIIPFIEEQIYYITCNLIFYFGMNTTIMLCLNHT